MIRTAILISLVLLTGCASAPRVELQRINIVVPVECREPIPDRPVMPTEALAPGVQLVDTPEFPAFIKPGASAARDMYTELQKESALDWTLLSPAVGFHGGSNAQSRGRTGQYRTGQDAPLMQDDGQPGDISAQDLAVALVDALEQHLHSKQRFTVAY